MLLIHLTLCNIISCDRKPFSNALKSFICSVTCLVMSTHAGVAGVLVQVDANACVCAICGQRVGYSNNQNLIRLFDAAMYSRVFATYQRLRI